MDYMTNIDDDNSSNNGSILPLDRDFSTFGNTIFALLYLSSFLLGNLLNSLTLLHFFSTKGWKTTSVLIQICINIVDIIICTLSLPVGLSWFAGRDGLMFEVQMMCNVWGMLWNIFIRMSVFLISVLSITRTVALCLPFRHICRNHVMVPICVYFAMMIVQSTIPFWYNKDYHYHVNSVSCLWFGHKILKKDSVSSIILNAVLVQTELIAPVFVVMICCIISVFALRSSRTQSTNTTKKGATITIIILTINYIIFNLPQAVYYIVLIVDREVFNHTLHWVSWDHDYLFSGAVLNLSVTLNSVMNPVLYFARVSQIREFGRRVVARVVRGCGENRVRPVNIQTRVRGSFEKCENSSLGPVLTLDKVKDPLKVILKD